MEPLQQVINITERSYTAMQGIVHFIGWSIAIFILYYVFKFVKKHNEMDERAKRYQGENPLDNLKEKEENKN